MLVRWAFYLVGVLCFSSGISITITVQHLGIHPWDVLNVAMFEKVGFSIGTWNIIFSITLIVISWILDKRYIKIGTFLNAVLVGSFVDLFLWLGIWPDTSHLWSDSLLMLTGIVVMGVGGGVYNAARVGSGPRDGFMLSIAEKVRAPIGRVRIIIESSVLVIGLLLGGPVFLFTFLFTFIQSPIFQFAFHRFDRLISNLDPGYIKKELGKSRARL